MPRLKLGTRGSALALRQAAHVAGLLRARHPELEVEQVVIRTEGDLRADVPLEAVGERGVFVRQLQHALLAREIDLAVHSLKDLPTSEPPGLVIAAVPPRADPRDALVLREPGGLHSLPPGARVGTGSPRRRCQLLHRRPDLRVVAVRGNLDTRIRKLKRGDVEALVLAVAGLQRLGIDDVAITPLGPDQLLPAVGQGALAVEARAEDPATATWLESLDDAPSAACVEAERALLRRLGGGCLAPAAAHARLEGGRLRVEGLVGDPDGRALLVESEDGPVASARGIGERLAARLLTAGAQVILARASGAPRPADDAARP